MTPGRAAEEPPKNLGNPKSFQRENLDVLCTASRESLSTIGPKLTGRWFNRRVVLLAAALIGVVAAAIYWSNHSRAGQRQQHAQSNHGGSAALRKFDPTTLPQEYFSDGIDRRDHIATGPTEFANLGVIARPRR